MILEQIYLGCLSQASYLIGDEQSGVAAVVDPRRDVEVYLEEAEKRGLAIRHVLLTHFHADFAAGHLELRERTGATIHLGRRARAAYPFHGLAEGDELALGRVRLKVLETPGHTPEAISILVFDDANETSKDPHAVLTGDTLFIGDVGRPDLLASSGVSAEELALMLYDSVHGKLLKLPDATLVYPGHGAGSMCGKNLSSKTVSTIGEQRQFNYALQPMDRESFVALITADQPRAPRYFGYDAELNRTEHGTLAEVLDALRPMSLAEVRAAMKSGAAVIDVRAPEAYAAGHLEGSVNLGLNGRFASWAGSVLDPGVSIVLVAPPGAEREAAMRLGRIGYDRVQGYLEGGADAIGGAAVSTPRYDARGLAGALAAREAPLVLDVREPGERAAKRIEGTLHIPLGELDGRTGELPHGRPIAIHCAGGYRSMIAASLLERAGFKDVSDLAGGIDAWVKSGLPTASGEAAIRT